MKFQEIFKKSNEWIIKNKHIHWYSQIKNGVKICVYPCKQSDCLKIQLLKNWMDERGTFYVELECSRQLLNQPNILEWLYAFYMNTYNDEKDK